MITVTNPEAIADKHGHPAGIRCKEINEQLQLIGWPTMIPYPTQADIDAWEAEYVPPVDPDASIQSDIAAAGTVEELKAALMGLGPNGARVRGRK